MPSHLHEALLELFRHRPSLAAELLGEALQTELPRYDEVRVESIDLGEIQPTEYRAEPSMRCISTVPGGSGLPATKAAWGELTNRRRIIRA